MAASNIDTSNGHYEGPKFSSKKDIILSQLRIILQGDIVLPTDLTVYNQFKVLTLDEYGRLSTQPYDEFQRSVQNLQSVTEQGNVTSLPIQQAPATNNNELVTKGQLTTELQDIIGTSPEVMQVIQELITMIDESDPTVQAILDALANKVDISQLGVDVQQLTVQGGQNRLPLNQAPLLTLQNITDNSATTTHRITGVAAVSANELTTLQQVQNLIQATTIPGLHSVLGAGNSSERSMILTDNIQLGQRTELTKTLLSMRSGIATAGAYNTQDYSGDKILFTHNYDTDKTSIQSIQVARSQADVIDAIWKDRLTTVIKDNQTGLILTSLDMGHAPTLGLSIDADLLDGIHASGFVTKTEFPLNTTGAITGNVLQFNGTNWVPQTVTGGQGLTYFTDSLVSSTSVLTPISINDIHLKTNSVQNAAIGLNRFTGEGSNNFLVSMSEVSSSIYGGNNIVLQLWDNFYELYGDNNTVIGSNIALGSESFAIQNNFIAHTTHNPTGLGYYMSNSVFIGNENLGFPSILGERSVSIGTIDSNLTGNNAVLLGTNNVSVRGTLSSAIGLAESILAANYTFASGIGHQIDSYAAAQFGSYSTIESGTPNETSPVTSNRAFVIGSGTSSVRKDALKLWKSGALEIAGTLKIGSDTGNEYGTISEGTLRWESGQKQIEVYKTGTWNPLAGGTSLTSDQLAAITNADSPSATNVFLTALDYNRQNINTQKFTILETQKALAELFPPTTIVNQEMDMFIPASTPGVPERTGTPITITAIDLIAYTIDVDFFPYFDGEINNDAGWIISESIGTEPLRTGQDQRYAYISSFARSGLGGTITYDSSKTRGIASWTVGTEVQYTNITRGWDYNMGSSSFKITNNPQVGSWTKGTVGQGGFYRTKSGEIRLVVNGYNSSTLQRSVGLAMPTTGDPAGSWTLDSSPRIPYSAAPAWTVGTSSGPVITSVIKSPTEDCFIGYFNTYTATREIGYVKFNEDMSWFEFGADPLITAVGLGAYQPSVIFFNGKYHMTLAELNSDSSPDAGNWTIGHYMSDHPTMGWTRIKSIDTSSYRDIKDCYRNSHSTECSLFVYNGKLCAFIDGTARYNAAGNRGQRNIGLMFYDEVLEDWRPYRVGPVFAGYQFADLVWTLPAGHTGGIASLILDENYLYFATALTVSTDNYKITISRKLIR